MDNLPYYEKKDDEIIKQFIDEHPFAFLAGCDAEKNLLQRKSPYFIEQEGG